jgi:predicted nuclease of predicted toxin-antitoxin system
MLRLASDADVFGAILRGLRLRQPGLDLVRIQDAGLRTAEDAAILEWAATEGRVLITRDRKTMIRSARAQIQAGLPMSGVLILRNRLTIGTAIEGILIAALCSEPGEWRDRVEFLPL